MNAGCVHDAPGSVDRSYVERMHNRAPTRSTSNGRRRSITHAGLERAVLGPELQHFGRPSRLRRALDAGVRVVVAHCASIEEEASLGLIGETAAELLKDIRSHNVLLFDFVLKRALRSRGKAFSPRIFETRRFFEGSPAA